MGSFLPIWLRCLADNDFGFWIGQSFWGIGWGILIGAFGGQSRYHRKVNLALVRCFANAPDGFMNVPMLFDAATDLALGARPCAPTAENILFI